MEKVIDKGNETVETIKNDKLNSKKEKHENKIFLTKEEVDTLNNKVNEANEKAIRMQAELINYRKRKDEEVERILKFANEDIILELLPIIDNFERALQALKDENPKMLEGMKMIYNSLINTLNKFEVEEIESLGKEFNENFHNAVMTDSVEGKNKNEIIEVYQKGYILKGKVIRPAMVKVNQ